MPLLLSFITSFVLVGNIQSIVADLGDPDFHASDFPTSPFVNGSAVFVANCSVVNCTLPDLGDDTDNDTPLDPPPLPLDAEPPPARKAKRRISSTSYNPNAIITTPEQRYRAHVDATNTWYIRAMTPGQDHQLLNTISGERGQDPTGLTGQSLPVTFHWGVDFIIPPWMLRQFASNHLDYARYGRNQDYRALRDMFRYSTTRGRSAVDPELQRLLNGPGNLVGGDLRYLRLRNLGLPSGGRWDLRRNWARERPTYPDEATLLVSLETDLQDRFVAITDELARRLAQMYPNSPELAQDFRAYVGFVVNSYRVSAAWLGGIRGIRSLPVPRFDRNNRENIYALVNVFLRYSFFTEAAGSGRASTGGGAG